MQKSKKYLWNVTIYPTNGETYWITTHRNDIQLAAMKAAEFVLGKFGVSKRITKIKYHGFIDA